MHNHCLEIQTGDLLEHIKKDSELVYLLFETEYFDDVWAAVSDVDFATSKRWQWSDTRFDQYASDGPLLVELERDSALIPYFIEHWAADNAAILIKTPYKLEQLLQHLQSLVVSRLPNGNEARFRFHEPRKMAGLLNALDEDSYHSLMGPIQQIIWRENCGSLQRWLQTANPQASAPQHGASDTGWFQFKQPQIDKMDTFEHDYFVAALSSKISEDIGAPGSDKPITHINVEQKKTLDDIIIKGMQSAWSIGIKDDESLKRYINACLYHPQILEHETTRDILGQTDVHANARMNQIEFWIEQNLNTHNGNVITR